MNPESASFKSYRIDAFLHHLKKKKSQKIVSLKISTSIQLYYLG